MADKPKPYAYLIDKQVELAEFQEYIIKAEAIASPSEREAYLRKAWGADKDSHLNIIEEIRHELATGVVSYQQELEKFKASSTYAALPKDQKLVVDGMKISAETIHKQSLEQTAYSQQTPAMIDRRIRALSEEIIAASRDTSQNADWRRRKLQTIHGYISSVGSRHSFDETQTAQLSVLWNRIQTVKAKGAINLSDMREASDIGLADLEKRIQKLSTRVRANAPDSARGQWMDDPDRKELELIRSRYDAMELDRGRLSASQQAALDVIKNQVTVQLEPWSKGNGGGQVDPRDAVVVDYALKGNSYVTKFVEEVVALSDKLKSQNNAVTEEDKTELKRLIAAYKGFQDNEHNMLPGQKTVMTYIGWEIANRLNPLFDEDKDKAKLGGPIYERTTEILPFLFREEALPDELKPKEADVEKSKIPVNPLVGVSPKPISEREPAPAAGGNPAGGTGGGSPAAGTGGGNPAAGGTGGGNPAASGPETEAQRDARERGTSGNRPVTGNDDGNLAQRAMDGVRRTVSSADSALAVNPNNPVDQATNGLLDWGGDAASSAASWISRQFSNAGKSSSGRSWIAVAAGIGAAILLPQRLTGWLESMIPGMKGALDTIPFSRTILALGLMYFLFKGVRKGVHALYGDNAEDGVAQGNNNGQQHVAPPPLPSAGIVRDQRLPTQAAPTAAAPAGTAAPTAAFGAVAPGTVVDPSIAAAVADAARISAEQAAAVDAANKAAVEKAAAEEKARNPEQRTKPPQEDGPDQSSNFETPLGIHRISHDGQRAGRNVIAFQAPDGMPRMLRGIVNAGERAEHEGQKTVAGMGGNRFVDGAMVAPHDEGQIILENVPASRTAMSTPATILPFVDARRKNFHVPADHSAHLATLDLSA